MINYMAMYLGTEG